MLLDKPEWRATPLPKASIDVAKPKNKTYL